MCVCVCVRPQNFVKFKAKSINNPLTRVRFACLCVCVRCANAVAILALKKNTKMASCCCALLLQFVSAAKRRRQHIKAFGRRTCIFYVCVCVTLPQ